LLDIQAFRALQNYFTYKLPGVPLIGGKMGGLFPQWFAPNLFFSLIAALCRHQASHLLGLVFLDAPQRHRQHDAQGKPAPQLHFRHAGNGMQFKAKGYIQPAVHALHGRSFVIFFLPFVAGTVKGTKSIDILEESFNNATAILILLERYRKRLRTT